MPRSFQANTTYSMSVAGMSEPLPPFGPSLDEHPNSINDGYYLNNPVGNSSWGDAPASYHNGAAGFSFADGHSEIHKWLSMSSQMPVKFTFDPPAFDAAGRRDYAWVIERTTIPYR